MMQKWNHGALKKIVEIIHKLRKNNTKYEVGTVKTFALGDIVPLVHVTGCSSMLSCDKKTDIPSPSVGLRFQYCENK